MWFGAFQLACKPVVGLLWVVRGVEEMDGSPDLAIDEAVMLMAIPPHTTRQARGDQLDPAVDLTS
jgi:hypothetical protein